MAQISSQASNFFNPEPTVHKSSQKYLESFLLLLIYETNWCNVGYEFAVNKFNMITAIALCKPKNHQKLLDFAMTKLNLHPEIAIELIDRPLAPSQFEDFSLIDYLNYLDDCLNSLGTGIRQGDAEEILAEFATVEICSDKLELLEISKRMKSHISDFNQRIWDQAYLAIEDRLNNSIWEERRQKSEKKVVTQSEDKINRAKLEIKQWLLESDPVAKAINKSGLCRAYGLDKATFDMIADCLDENSAKPKSQTYSAEKFMILPTGTSRTLAPGIPNMGVTLFAGDPGAGKTTLAYDLAGSVINGEEFLGEVPSRTGPVLFVNCDEPHIFGQEKIINRGIPGNFTVLMDWDVSQWIDLETLVEDMRPALVIIDSFNAIHLDPSFDENSAIASQTIKKLERLSAKYCAPVVLIHHLSKSKENKGVNKIRGSSAIAASVSSVMILDGEGTVKGLSQPKVRGMEPLNLQVEMNPETGRFTVISGNIADDATKSLSQRLKDFFTAQPGKFFENREIYNLFPGNDSKVVNNALNRLIGQGHIIKRPSKTNPRFKVYGCESAVDSLIESLSVPLTKKEEHIPPCPPVKLDDVISESVTTQGLYQIITTSPSDHHYITVENKVIPETLTETTNHQITTVDQKEVYECPPPDDDLENIPFETSSHTEAQSDRTLKAGSIVTCEKYPGEILVIGEISGTQAHCCTTSGDKWIALSDLALSV